jgi:phosphinothricin acetyltransferase
VADDGGRALGYAYGSRFRPRPAYQWTAEVTVYLHPEARGRGVATALYSALCDCLRRQGFFAAIGVITIPNPSSVALHEKLGFRRIGVFPRVGFKLGGWHDVGWWSLALGEPVESPPPPLPLSRLPERDFQTALERGLERLRR